MRRVMYLSVMEGFVVITMYIVYVSICVNVSGIAPVKESYQVRFEKNNFVLESVDK
jgi:hypothetical protein